MPQETLIKWAFGLIATAALLSGMFIWGHHVGYTGEKAIYDKYVSDQKAAAEAQVDANQKALDQAQQDYSKSVANLQSEHNNEISKLAAARDAAIADSAAYAGRLRDYLARASGQPAGVSRPASGAAGTEQAGGGGLYDGVSELNRYLVQRFYLADENASKLNMAIGLLAEDRKICNGALPGITADVSSPTH